MKHAPLAKQPVQKKAWRYLKQNKRTSLLMLISVALCLWGPAEMAIHRTFYPEFLVTIIAGAVATGYLLWSILYLTSESRPR